MSRNYYSPGSWNIICDSCSKKIKASESKQRWDGLIVCPSCYEQRHPQDFVKARQDKITVPFSRPRPPDVFNLTQGVFENVPIQDTIRLRPEYNLSYSDNVFITDVITVSKSYSISDTLAIDDSFSVTLDKQLQDTVSILENLSYLFDTHLADTVTITDTANFVLTKITTLTDTVLITDAGSMTIPVYAIDYFAEDYTQTSQTFT